MKMEHHKKNRSVPSKTFFTIDDVASVTNYIRVINAKNLLSSEDVARFLANQYDNLIATPVKALIHDGAVETAHWVSVTRSGEYLIDITGDRFNYTNDRKYALAMTPWIYKLFPRMKFVDKNQLYISLNHLPITSALELEDSGAKDEDVIRLTKNPFYRGLRGIVI